MSTIDEETRSLARLALRNAFYADFSAMVLAYRDAARGVDGDHLDFMDGLQDLASVFSASDDPGTVHNLQVTTNGSSPHKTILGALRDPRAQTVEVQATRFFVKRQGEWWYTQ